MGIFRRGDGRVFESRGYRASTPSADVRRFQVGGRVASLPPRVDLRPLMTPIEDQRQTNSCVANAVAGAYEYLVKRHLGDEAYDVSRLFIYYNARVEEGGEDEDEGTTIESAIAGLTEHGACSEETWPFDEERVNEEPDEEAYEEAAQFLIEDVAAVPTSLEAWKSCLAEGYPIVFGLLLYDSFDRHRKRGLVPVPTAREAAREEHGGHAMLCVGYSDPDEVFIVRNSWGPRWGDRGYCYIPYAYLMDTRYNDGDTWLIRRVEEVELDEETWGDDSSMIEDVETELGRMPDEAYGDLLDACGDVPLEVRLALMVLFAARVDGSIETEELDHTTDFLKGVMEIVGRDDISYVGLAAHVLEHHINDEALVRDSARIFSEHLSSEALAAIWKEMSGVAEANGAIDEAEEDLLYWLVAEWQLDEDEEDEAWGEEDDEDEEDDVWGDEDEEDEADEDDWEDEEDEEEDDDVWGDEDDWNED